MKKWKKYISKLNYNGVSYDYKSLKELLEAKTKSPEKEIIDFIGEWINEKDYILVSTSGSTGNPKTIRLSKNTMAESAMYSGRYLGLKKGDTALLCMPAKFIAGKMMLVRAFVLDLHLDSIAPSTRFKLKNNYDFVAMTPHQTAILSKHNPGNFNFIHHLIIGGGPISSELELSLHAVTTSCYASYGMTETSTHIALQKINGPDKQTYFELIDDSIEISCNQDSCLEIKAPYLGRGKITTNDIVEIIDRNKFVWKGRADNIINSGGIKIQPELVEKKLQPAFRERIIIFGEEDPVFQQRVCMLIEKCGPVVIDSVLVKLTKTLKKYEIPNVIYQCDRFTETRNGKIIRSKSIISSKLIYSKTAKHGE